MNGAMDHVPCGILSFTGEGSIVAVNQTLLALLGVEEAAVAGRPFAELLSKGGRIFYQTHLFPLLRMRGEVEEIYVSLYAANGDEIPMLLNARVRTASTGAVLYDVILVRVKQRALFENALLNERKKAQEASKAKDDFLAALSHELRNPLNPILLLATEMETDLELPTTARHQASVIRRNAELEARLIDDLLDLTRIAHGKLHLVRSVFDVHELLVLTEDIARSESEMKRVDLIFTKEAAECHMDGDSTRIQQVFWNLLKNAIKFTPAGGSVQVRTWNSAPGKMAISVTDTGIGIPADTLPYIFKAFEQGRISRQEFGGLGLGLAIAKSIVDLHEGAIEVDSPGPGEGTVFTLNFDTCLPSHPEPKPAAVQKPANTALRLLLVEDHDSTRDVLTRILRRAGHEVHPARTGAEALTIASTTKGLDAVISDIGLPDQSGLDLMRNLKAAYPGLTGIALSGYGMEQDLNNARNAGFAAHLVKPVAMDQLHALLRQIAAGGLAT